MLILVPLMAAKALACNYSSFSLVSMTDIGGGQYEFVVNYCIGGGPGGADQSTYLWAIELVGPATWASWPSSLTSPQTGAIFTPDNTFYYGGQYLIYTVDTYPGTGWGASAWATTGGGFGAAGSYCTTFTLVTNGIPDQLLLLGAEAAGIIVPPYGCNGAPDMEINFGLAVDAGPSVNLCAGNSTTLSASAVNGTPPYSYVWSNGATTASTTVSPTVNTTYTVTVTDAVGNTDAENVVVSVNPKPVVNAGIDKTIYIGYGATCTTLTATATGASAPYTYSWTGGGTGLSKTVCPTVTTNYTFTATDYYGCSSSDVVQVIVKDVRCGPSLTKVYVCKNGTTKCITTGQVPSYLTSGWVLGACWMRLDETIAISENPMAVFPNPASNQADVAFIMPVDGTATIQIYGLNGQQYAIQNAEVFAYSGEEVVQTIDVSELPAGVYQILITTAEGHVMTDKLAVVR